MPAARQGHDVVMSPSNKTYLDYLQTASPNEPPGRPTQVNLGKLYNFEPVPAELAADKRGHILGLQANMFTEHTRSYARLQHNLFPRLAAVAETGWTPQAGKDYPDFLARLPAQLHRYSAMGIVGCRHHPPRRNHSSGGSCGRRWGRFVASGGGIGGDGVPY